MPFGENEDDSYKVYYSVVSQKLKFPNFFNEEDNKNPMNFIKKLLSRYPESRIDGGYASLKSHKWFEDFDWSALLEKTLPPPLLPPPQQEF